MPTEVDLQVGDIVKLITDRHGEAENNPVWGGQYGYTIGVLDEIADTYLPIHVRWSNGRSNDYSFNDLAIAHIPKIHNINGKTPAEIKKARLSKIGYVVSIDGIPITRVA